MRHGGGPAWSETLAEKTAREDPRCITPGKEKGKSRHRIVGQRHQFTRARDSETQESRKEAFILPSLEVNESEAKAR